jgi:hypothetical protein
MIDPSSRQSGRPTSTKPKLSDSNKNRVLSPRWGLTPRLTNRLTVGCNVTLILISTCGSLEKFALSEAGVRWPPACEEVSPQAEQRPLLENFTKQSSKDRVWEHKSFCDSDL